MRTLIDRTQLRGAPIDRFSGRAAGESFESSNQRMACIGIESSLLRHQVSPLGVLSRDEWRL